MYIIGALLLSKIAVVLLICIYNKSNIVFCKSEKKLKTKTALVTGGTSGIGLEIAKNFAKRGAKVIIACPFRDEGENAKKEIIQHTGNNNVVFKNLDLGSFASVRDFAADILKSEDRLDILVNNAGIIEIIGIKPSKDGLNRVMQVNFYGHFLLTQLLLPLLKKSAPSRIINTGSLLHKIAKLNQIPSNYAHHWCPIVMYGNSKLCLIHYARELTRRLNGSGVTINNADPGAVATPAWNSIVGRAVGSFITSYFRSILKTPFEGAQTAVYVALEDSLEKVSGEYFANCEIGRASLRENCAKDTQLVWNESVRICELSDDEMDSCFN